jgi:CTP:molybdopterin cytidylyltransferase MocA
MKRRSAPGLRIVVLAAGLSRRLGQPKALARVRGRSLLERTVRVMAPFADSLGARTAIIVVVPPGAGRYRRAVRHPVTFVVNPDRASGLASSVRVGLARARPAAAVLLLPVDLVALTRRDIARLITRWRGMRRHVVAQRLPDGAGTPLILPRWLCSRAEGLEGDQGLRAVVRSLPRDRLSLVELKSAHPDVDLRRDLETARRRIPTHAD